MTYFDVHTNLGLSDMILLIIEWDSTNASLIYAFSVIGSSQIIQGIMLALNLNRVDYTQVGVTTNQALQVLPASATNKGIPQKIVIGDFDGVVTCLGIKKHLPQIIFKTLPGNKISSVKLGGESAPNNEKIFAAAQNDVKGYSKKGKQFLTFTSNIAEPIESIHVEGLDLYLCGNYIFNQYYDCQDKNYFLSPDKVNDMSVLKIGDDFFAPVLACQDRVLRVLKDSELFYEIEVPGPPNVLTIGTDETKGNNGVIYGTTDGKVGLVQVSFNAPEHIWEIPNTKNYGSIQSLSTFDVSNDGTDDLLVGRADGVVEVYAFDEANQPFQHFKCNLTESITGVAGGCVCAANYHEVVVSTYTGWLIGLTSEPQQRALGMPGTQVQEVNPELEAKISELNLEVEDLQTRIARDREVYHQTANSDTAVSAVPLFNVNDNFMLSHDDSSYVLSIEVQMPIDTILLQSDVPVDLLDVEKNSAVVSYSTCDQESGNFLLATYRCQANTTRLELKIRTIEGQYGHLQAYITPRLQPKTCQLRRYQIKPLSLHQRSHSFDNSRPHNTLRLSGSFSLAEIHSWICYSLPDAPQRTPVEDNVTFHFTSTFLDTQLEAKYSKGEAIFRSDNISTISILKDVVTKEATKRKINLSINCDLNEESIPNVLYRIHPKLEYQLLLAKRVQLIDGLKELVTYEGDNTFLTEEYQDILANADKFVEEFKKQPCHLERLYGMITDLYIDRYKFKGLNVKNKVSQLINLLDNYDLNALIEFFEA